MARKAEGAVKQAEIIKSKDKSDEITGMQIDDKMDKYDDANLFIAICTLLGICDKDGIVK